MKKMSASRSFTVGEFLDGAPDEWEEGAGGPFDETPLQVSQEIMAFGSFQEPVNQTTSLFRRASNMATRALKLTQPINTDRVEILAQRFTNVETLTLPQAEHYVDEALPAVHLFGRLKTLIIPVMDAKHLHMLARCRWLRHLKMDQLKGLSEDGSELMDLLEQWPDLETVQACVVGEVTFQLRGALPPKFRKLAICGAAPDASMVDELLRHESMRSLEISSWSDGLVDQVATYCRDEDSPLSEIILKVNQAQRLGVLPRVRSVEIVDEMDWMDMQPLVQAFPHVEEFRNSRQHVSLDDVELVPTMRAEHLRPWQATLRHCELPRYVAYSSRCLQFFEHAPLLETLQVVFVTRGHVTFQCPPNLKKLRLAVLSPNDASYHRMGLGGTLALRELDVSAYNMTLTLQGMPRLESLSIWHSGGAGHGVHVYTQDVQNIHTAFLEMDSRELGPVLQSLQASNCLTSLTVRSISTLENRANRLFLSNIGNLTNLQMLSVHMPSLSCKKARWVRHLRSLRSLTIQAGESKARLWKDLARVPALEKLFLTFEHAPTQVEAAISIPHLIRLRQLTDLHLVYIKGFKGTLDLEPLAALQNLQVLLLPSADETHNLWRLKSLRRLFFVHVEPRAGVWRQIADLKHLEVLGVRDKCLSTAIHASELHALPGFLSLQVRNETNGKTISKMSASGQPPIFCALFSDTIRAMEPALRNALLQTLAMDISELDDLPYYCDYLMVEESFEREKEEW